MTEAGFNRLLLNTSNTFRTGAGQVLMRGQAQIFGPGIYFQQNGVTTGSGTNGGGGMGINNQGTIAATYPGETLSIIAQTRADMNNLTYNSGTLTASGGGVLAVTMPGGGSLQNSGGFIAPGANSLVRFDGVPVFGGVLRGAGITGFATRGPNSISGLRNEGVVDQLNGMLFIGQGVDNAGTIRSSGYTPGFNDGLRFESAVTMNGGGRLLMGNGVSDGIISGVGPLTLGAGLTVSFTRPTGITGVTYGAQSSTNLSAWPAVPDSGSGDTITFSASAGVSPRLFMRLNAAMAP